MQKRAYVCACVCASFFRLFHGRNARLQEKVKDKASGEALAWKAILSRQTILSRRPLCSLHTRCARDGGGSNPIMPRQSRKTHFAWVAWFTVVSVDSETVLRHRVCTKVRIKTTGLCGRFRILWDRCCQSHRPFRPDLSRSLPLPLSQSPSVCACFRLSLSVHVSACLSLPPSLPEQKKCRSQAQGKENGREKRRCTVPSEPIPWVSDVINTILAVATQTHRKIGQREGGVPCHLNRPFQGHRFHPHLPCRLCRQHHQSSLHLVHPGDTSPVRKSTHARTLTPTPAITPMNQCTHTCTFQEVHARTHTFAYSHAHALHNAHVCEGTNDCARAHARTHAYALGRAEKMHTRTKTHTTKRTPTHTEKKKQSMRVKHKNSLYTLNRLCMARTEPYPHCNDCTESAWP